MDIRLIVDRIPAFTWSAHADGSVEFVNQRWREYAGLSDEESQGWGWQAAIHPPGRARGMALIPVTLRLTIIAMSGGLHLIARRPFPMLDSQLKMISLR
jgi:PAS domain-containing protein